MFIYLIGRFAAVTCPSLSTFGHADVAPTNNCVFGDHVVISCENGYELGHGQSSANVTCLATGNWSLDLDVNSCSPVTCPTPPYVGNSTRIGSGSSFGSVVVYTCPRGYYMGSTSEATFTGSRISTATIHCQADAQWSSQPDNCSGATVDCLLSVSRNYK